jgi:cytochrome c oxidase assembly protein subunit 16
VLPRSHAHQFNMAFTNKKFPSSKEAHTIASRYRAALAKHPFALFGLPFIATMVAGSFFLTPATAIRYEKYDRKVQRMSKEEELSIRKSGRRVDMKEEYYVSLCFNNPMWLLFSDTEQRLAAKDLENWEQRRVKRLPGEPDGVI